MNAERELSAAEMTEFTLRTYLPLYHICIENHNMHLFTHTYASNTGETEPHRAAQQRVMLYTLNTAQCLCINTETSENALKIPLTATVPHLLHEFSSHL